MSKFGITVILMRDEEVDQRIASPVEVQGFQSMIKVDASY